VESRRRRVNGNKHKVFYVNVNVKPLLKIETFRGNIQSGGVTAG